MKRIFKICYAFLAMFCVLTMGFLSYAQFLVKNEYVVTDINDLKIKTKIPLQYLVDKKDYEQVDNSGKRMRYNVVFEMFGVFPVKTASVTVKPRDYVDLIGKPFGVKLYTDGLLIVNLSEFENENGKTVCPAKKSGLKTGDYIISVNGEKIYSNNDISRIVKFCSGEKIEIVYSRNDDVKSVFVKPIKGDDGQFHLGLWLKDSSAGIGTITFYDENKKVLAGLGHALCDPDTGKKLSVNSGSILPAEILSVTKSSNGSTGELMGRFKNFEYSKTLLNDETGIYAVGENEINVYGKYPVALKDEITKSDAQILSTIDGEIPQKFSCEITKIIDKNSEQRNIIVEITDKELIDKCGGIVQGMSGSPIIQNGRFIGALTHVLVDDPTRGYGIFAENMLETAIIARSLIQ